MRDTIFVIERARYMIACEVNSLRNTNFQAAKILEVYAIDIQSPPSASERDALAWKLVPLSAHSHAELRSMLDRGRFFLAEGLPECDAIILERRLHELGVTVQVVQIAASQPESDLSERHDGESKSHTGQPIEQSNTGAGWSEIFPDIATTLPAAPVPDKEPEVVASAVAPMASDKESFDGTRVALGVVEQAEQKPRYTPQGFDEAPEHIPLLAALLSVMAPGAGQVYNGQGADAGDVARRTYFFRPWVNSVRSAHRYAEQIRSYHAPRPSKGALVRALRFVAIRYFFVALGCVVLILGVRAFHNTQSLHEIDEVMVEHARSEAHFHIRYAWMQAVSESEREYYANETSELRFTMSEDERAERLFRIGYVYCSQASYLLCESTMARVTQLDKGYTAAYRLQAWATAQRNRRGSPEAMPSVEVRGTLSDLEMELEIDNKK